MPKATADLDLELIGRLRISLARVARLLRQQDDAGLTPTSVAMLATIARDGPITLGDLAAKERLAPPTITKAVSRLEADGLVERIPDPTDRRVCRVRLSPAGSKQLVTIQSRRTAWLARRFGDLSPAEQARLAAAVDVLERLAEP